MVLIFEYRGVPCKPSDTWQASKLIHTSSNSTRHSNLYHPKSYRPKSCLYIYNLQKRKQILGVWRPIKCLSGYAPHELRTQDMSILILKKR